MDDEPRDYNAALKVVRNRTAKQPAARAWIRENLAGTTTAVQLSVTSTRMRFPDRCWELTLNGERARPDRPTLPPDMGVVVGRLVALSRGETPPSPC